MHLINFGKIALGLCTAAVIASCSISTDMDASIEREVEMTSKMKEKAKVPSTKENTDLIKVNNDIWLGDQSEIEYEGEPLPSYLEGDKGITLISNRPITLYEIGDMINKITSLGVRYAPQLESDVFKNAADNKPSPETINADWTEPDKMLVSYQGSLSGLLNEIASRFGIWWNYEKKEIHFYKYVTRTFVLYTLPTNPNLSVNVGGSATGGGGSASLTLSSSAQIELWANIEKTITSMIDPNAKLSMVPSDGTITLTATPNDIKKVAKYINEQNQRLSRQVAVSVKVLQVTINDSDKYGLNLSAAFTDAGGNLRKLAIDSAGNLSDVTSGISTSIVSGRWTLDGAIRALSEQGTTTLVTSGTVTTMNNKPAPIQVMRKENYISEITKTNSGTDGDNYDISVTTEEIEVGFTMDVLPRILEHGRMMLMFNMTLSDLVDMEKVEFGKQDDGQYIQNPIIESRGFTQEVAMTSGESLILSGYEKVDNQVNKTGIGSATNSLLGGTATAAKTRSALVIILTPVILETPLNPETRMKSL